MGPGINVNLATLSPQLLRPEWILGTQVAQVQLQSNRDSPTKTEGVIGMTGNAFF